MIGGLYIGRLLQAAALVGLAVLFRYSGHYPPMSTQELEELDGLKVIYCTLCSALLERAVYQ